jgi:thiosulfate/3-mercaptopyruvate sulfurtransferase
MYATLISAAELHQHLGLPDWAIVDCRFSLADEDMGRREYQNAHIPGAVYAHLNEDLSGPVIKGQTGRHPLPAVPAIVEKLSAWGIEQGVQVVAYDEYTGGMAAARLWWLLNWLGHPAVAVLDGGWQGWSRPGVPTRAGEENRVWRPFIPSIKADLVVESEEVSMAVHDPDVRIIDARGADRYRGENESIDPVAGHIPGAVSAPYLENLDPDGRFISPEALKARFSDLLAGLPGEQAIFYCGSGVTAAQALLAMAHSGLGMGRLYAGSWSEWILDPERPVTRG